MTLSLASLGRAAGQFRGRGAIVTLAAVAISAIAALAALGIADRRAADHRLTTQMMTSAVDTAQAIFDRDRQLLQRMTDAKAAGPSDDAALPALPPELRAAVLFDPAGAPLASTATGLNAARLASLGDAVARAVAFHPGSAPLVVPGIGDGGAAIVALVQPWVGADGFSGGIGVIAFDRNELVALDRLGSGDIDVVTTDGMSLFAAANGVATTGDRLEAISGVPLMLRYRPPLNNSARIRRSAAPFALIAIVAFAAASGLAILLIRRDRAARREIERRASVERELREKLRTTAAVAERADEITRTKSRFLAQVTHELRTPLNAILGFSETIRQQMFGPVTNSRYLEYAGLIHDAGSHLLSLINDLLDNARIEAGKMEIAPIRVSAAAVARSALDLVELLAEERKVTLTASGFGTCPDLNVDPRAMKQVLVNLLSNAIKYTPAGGRIEMRFAARPEGGVAIEVADTGTGMSAEDVLHAFEPFGRAARRPGTPTTRYRARSVPGALAGAAAWRRPDPGEPPRCRHHRDRHFASKRRLWRARRRAGGEDRGRRGCGASGLELHALRKRTVDDQIGAGDETRARAGEEHDRVGDLLRRTHAPGRIARQHRLEHLGIALLDDVPYPALEVDIAGRDHVGADILGGEVARQPLHVRKQRCLDRGVGAGRAVHLGHRGAADDNDRAGHRFLEERQRRLAAEYRRHHVDLEALTPSVLVHALCQGADIGDKNVDAAERARRLANPTLERREVGDIDRSAPGLDALLLECSDGLGHRAGAARTQRYVCNLPPPIARRWRGRCRACRR